MSDARNYKFLEAVQGYIARHGLGTPAMMDETGRYKIIVESDGNYRETEKLLLDLYRPRPSPEGYHPDAKVNIGGDCLIKGGRIQKTTSKKEGTTVIHEFRFWRPDYCTKSVDLIILQRSKGVINKR